MKKFMGLTLALAICMTGCGEQVQQTEQTQQTQQTGQTEQPPKDELVQGASGLAKYVEEGLLTQETADALQAYLEANKPGGEGMAPETGSVPPQQGGEVGGTQQEGMMVDPLAGAVAEGILTQEQADAIDFETLIPEQQGGPSFGASTLTVEEANAIEEELLTAVGYTAEVGGYPIVDTNQTRFYSNDAILETAPIQGEAFYGQDASYTGNAPSYTDNGDGTVSDNVTGLMWQQDPGEKLTWPEAVDKLEEMNATGYAGYTDWRIPSMKELYSLTDFSGLTRKSSDTSVPYINTDYFAFEYGDAVGEARFIDSQILTSTIYDAETMGGATTVFGYNFADGRIKGYEIDKDFYCYYVRGNTSYGQNLFVDNGDATITDQATQLMWTQNDSGYYKAGELEDGTMNWEEALEWVEAMNEKQFLGYSDWRLPNIKELQSLVDYTKSVTTTDSPAIDELFYCTPIINCFGLEDYGYYWSGTTHDDTSASPTEYNAASYMVFGDAMGVMNGEMVDAHGSGSQKSDPKTGERENYPAPDEIAPQGDEQRVFNMVRLVRDAD